MSSETAPKKAAPKEPEEGVVPVVIDLGRKSRKLVRRMRRGKGKLMNDIMDSIEELKENGEISKDAQPVIVVVRQKRRKRKGFPFSLI